jgi:hypothetical protein
MWMVRVGRVQRWHLAGHVGGEPQPTTRSQRDHGSPSQAIKWGVRIKNPAFQLKSVFDHDADPNQVEALRSAVVKNLHALLSAYSNFGEITVADLDPDMYPDMRGRYRRLLHYGVFYPGKRTVGNELI